MKNNQQNFALCLAVAAWSGAKNFEFSKLPDGSIGGIHAVIKNQETGKNEVITFNASQASIAAAINNGTILGSCRDHIDTSFNPELTRDLQGKAVEDIRDDEVLNIIDNKINQILLGELPQEELDNMRESLVQFSQMEKTGNLIIDNGIQIACTMLDRYISTHEDTMESIEQDNSGQILTQASINEISNGIETERIFE